MCVKGDQSPTTAPQVEVHNMMNDMNQEDLEGMMKEKVGVGQEYQEVAVCQEDLIHKDQPQ